VVYTIGAYSADLKRQWMADIEEQILLQQEGNQVFFSFLSFFSML
jgi:hypothetical protein